jgi:hypothetical protein
MSVHSREQLVSLLDRALAFIEEPGNYSDHERSELLDDMSEAVVKEHPAHWE